MFALIAFTSKKTLEFKLLIAAATIAVMGAVAVAGIVHAAEDAQRQVLFTNVNIFNGTDGKLIKNGFLLVEGNLIKTVPDY